MAWESGRHWGNIPAAVRREVRRRDNDECQLRYPCCTGKYEELDHINNIAARGISRADDKPTAEQLQAVCRACHKWKTAAEARNGRQRRKGEPKPARKHPGLLW